MTKIPSDEEDFDQKGGGIVVRNTKIFFRGGCGGTASLAVGENWQTCFSTLESASLLARVVLASSSRSSSSS